MQQLCETQKKLKEEHEMNAKRFERGFEKEKNIKTLLGGN